MSKNAVQIPSDMDIMMFLDGELTGEDAKRVETFLANDEDAGAKAVALGQITEFVRGNLELAADDAEDKLSGLWAGIERSIHSNGASKTPADVISIESASQKAEQRATDELVKKASWFGGWQSHLITGAIVAAAVAVLMIATRPQTAPPQTQAARQVVAPPTTIPVALKSQAPEVEELEVYEGNGTIMMVGDESDGDSSAVIWISSDTDLIEDPI